MTMNRRELLRSTAFVGLGAAVAAGSIDTEFGASPAFAGTDGKAKAPGFGPLVPDPNKLLDLPAGFTYTVVTRAGDAMDGTTLVRPTCRPSRPSGPSCRSSGSRSPTRWPPRPRSASSSTTA